MKEEKKKRGIKKETSNTGGKLKVRRGPHIKKDSLTEGKSAGTEKGTLEDQRRTQQTVCGRQGKVRTAHMINTAALCIPA